MYLSTAQGSTIGLTGVGTAYKIEPGKTLELTLLLLKCKKVITDALSTCTYAAFFSGNEYTADILGFQLFFICFLFVIELLF